MTKLLLVDDDTMILKLYKRYFEKHFEVTTASSAIEALEIIKKKYHPEVILSDHLMPEMNGSDFLNQISFSHQNTIRILMTAESEPSKLIPNVNHAKAFMFLIKPIKEIDLIQAVNLAAKHYKLMVQNEQLIKKLNEQNQKMSKEIAKSNVTSTNAVYEMIFGLRVFQGNYFYNHFEGVIKIANYFITEMKLGDYSKQELLKISLYYELMMLTFPSRLAYKNPFTLKEKESADYVAHFVAFIEKVKKVSPFDSLSQIWEHADGSGIPNKLKVDKISIESQIFQLSNLYFHLLYELPNNDVTNKLNNSTFKYRYEGVMDKMKKAQKYILEKNKWFNEDLFSLFRFAIKDNKVEAFLPVRENIEVENKDYMPEFEKILKELHEFKAKEENAPEIVQEGDQNYAIKQLHPHQLAIGMIINQNIVSIQNVPVIKMGAKITGSLLDNIHNLFDKKQLKDATSIEVKIPV